MVPAPRGGTVQSGTAPNLAAESKLMGRYVGQLRVVPRRLQRAWCLVSRTRRNCVDLLAWIQPGSFLSQPALGMVRRGARAVCSQRNRRLPHANTPRLRPNMSLPLPGTSPLAGSAAIGILVQESCVTASRCDFVVR